MIPRNIASKLSFLASTSPVVTVTGLRQSGKTTLCRQVFPEHRYISLERPDLREWVFGHPRTSLSIMHAGFFSRSGLSPKSSGPEWRGACPQDCIMSATRRE